MTDDEGRTTKEKPPVSTLQSPVSFRAASEFDIATLARLYTRTFEGYVVAVTITPEMLETWIRVEDLRLDLSPVLCVGDTPVGFATVGLRGEHAYCRGFGIVPEFRGQGLANELSQEIVERARSVHASDMVLGVLIDNTKAVKSYRASGFEPVRELHSVEWKGEHAKVSSPAADVAAIESACALAQYETLHSVHAVWNRDLPSLEKMRGLQGLAILENNVPLAYVLYRADAGKVEIVDLTSPRTADGQKLLRALQGKFDWIVCYNEPESSTAHAAFRACDFRVTQRRYEMRVGGLT